MKVVDMIYYQLRFYEYNYKQFRRVNVYSESGREVGDGVVEVIGSWILEGFYMLC